MGCIRVAYHFMGALNLKYKEFVLIINLGAKQARNTRGVTVEDHPAP
jgi:hypothetical protein